jgi:hypothetical protein
MELPTLFIRESAAGSYSRRSYLNLFNSSERLMASPLFRIHNVILAGWKTGSREIVGLKMAV